MVKQTYGSYPKKVFVFCSTLENWIGSRNKDVGLAISRYFQVLICFLVKSVQYQIAKRNLGKIELLFRIQANVTSYSARFFGAPAEGFTLLVFFFLPKEINKEDFSSLLLACKLLPCMSAHCIGSSVLRRMCLPRVTEYLHVIWFVFSTW